MRRLQRARRSAARYEAGVAGASVVLREQVEEGVPAERGGVAAASASAARGGVPGMAASRRRCNEDEPRALYELRALYDEDDERHEEAGVWASAGDDA